MEKPGIIRRYTYAGRNRKAKGTHPFGGTTIQLALTEDIVIVETREKEYCIVLYVRCLWYKFAGKTIYRKLAEEASTVEMSKPVMNALFGRWRHDRILRVQTKMTLSAFRRALRDLQQNLYKSL